MTGNFQMKIVAFFGVYKIETQPELWCCHPFFERKDTFLTIEEAIREAHFRQTRTGWTVFVPKSGKPDKPRLTLVPKVPAPRREYDF